MYKAHYVRNIEKNLKELSEEIKNIKLLPAEDAQDMTLEQLELLTLGSQSLLDSIKFFNRSVRTVLIECGRNIEEEGEYEE